MRRNGVRSPWLGTGEVYLPQPGSGQFSYKLAERIGGAVAIAPVLQGLAKPANDLSRGCSGDDVYYTIAMTSAQAEGASPNRTAPLASAG